MKLKFIFSIFYIVIIMVIITPCSSLSADFHNTETQEPLYEKIRKIAIEGKHTQAIALAKQQLDQHPNDVDTRVILGQIYTWTGDYNNAIAQFERVLKLKPDYLDSRNSLINIAIWTKDYAHASQLIAQGLKITPQQPELLRQQSLVNDLITKPNHATKILQKVLDTQSNEKPFSTYQTLQQLALEGNSQEAINKIQLLLEKDPGNSDLLLLLGHIYAWEGQRTKAKEQYQTLLKESPDYIDAIVGLIDLALWDKDYKRALNLTQDGLKKDPENVDLLKHLEIIYTRTDQDKKANLIISKIQKIDDAYATIPKHSLLPMSAQKKLPISVAQSSASYKKIRFLALHNESKKAKLLALKAIKNSPPNYDMRILLGRIYYWDSDYANARDQFSYVLNNNPGYVDALIGLIDVETREHHHQKALELEQSALNKNPKHLDLLYHEAMSLRYLDKDKEAHVVLLNIEKIDPNYSDVRKLLEENPLARRDGPVTYPSQLEIIEDYSNVSDLTNPWRIYSLSYSHVTPIGSMVARVNHAHRFGTTGEQYEIDAYPSLMKGVYAYLNYGYSDAPSVFARNRIGGELFVSLPKSFEISGGVRYLMFAGGTTTLYTGTLAKYFGNYYIIVRGYTSPQPRWWSRSAQIKLRRYFSDPNFYMGINFSHGVSPGTGLILLPSDVDVASNTNIEYEFRIPLYKQLYMKFFTGYSNQILTNHKKRSIDYVGGGFGALF